MDDMKQSISVTVEKTLVGWIDAQVKTQRFRNRSHAVEVALRKYIESEKKEV
jgi:Arc/MetJ-type ribon-helix-helix transcriptional regulator